MVLPGCRTGSLCASNRGLGTVGKARRGTGDQGAGYGLRTTGPAFGSAVPLGSRIAICKSVVSPKVVAIPHTSEHEPARKLQG